MQFVFVVRGQGASVPQTLVTDRLLVVATRETVHRTRHGRDRDKKKAASAPLQISGTRLRDLCWGESPLSRTLSIAKDDLTFHCAMVQTPYAQGRRAGVELDAVPVRTIAADDLEHVYFNVHEDLLQDGRLVVFTHADNLLHVGIDADAWAEARAAAATAASAAVSHGGGGGGAGSGAGVGSSVGASSSAESGTAAGGVGGSSGKEAAADGGAAQKRQRRSGLAWEEEEPRPSARRLDSPHTPHSLLKKEQVLAVVPATASSEDIRDLNNLIDHGRMNALDSRLSEFFCSHCGHLPLLTLTMSCCGAVLCQQCVPTPPTVDGAGAAERACPVCGEEPLDPPVSHAGRDAMVGQLVKELKVLYYPQLQAARESQHGSAAASTPSTPPFLTPNTPVLGMH